MSALRRVAQALGFDSQSAETQTDQTVSAARELGGGAARERLRQGIASRTPARKQLADAAAARRNARDLFARAQDANARVADLERAVAAARQQWVEEGSDTSVAAVDPVLKAQLDAAKATATEAHENAEAAEAGLHKLAAAERDAQMMLDTTEGTIKLAAMDVVIAEKVVLLLKKRRRLVRAYNDVQSELDEVTVLARPLWGASHRFAGFSGGSAGSILAREFAEFPVRVPPSDEALRHHVDKLVDLDRVDALVQYLRRLCADPDAQQ